MNCFEQLRAAGVQYWFEGERFKYRGKAEKLTPKIMGCLAKAKGHLAGCLSGERAWGNVPPDDMPPRKGLPPLTPEQEELIIAHIERQPEHVLRWALDRSAIYEANKPDMELRRAHLAAALDVIQWQRPDLPTAAEIVAELEGIESAHNFFTRRGKV